MYFGSDPVRVIGKVLYCVPYLERDPAGVLDVLNGSFALRKLLSIFESVAFKFVIAVVNDFLVAFLTGVA